MLFEHNRINEVKTNKTIDKIFDKGINDKMPLRTPSKATINGEEIQKLECVINVEEP